MKKIGYFFLAFVPLLAAVTIQVAAQFFTFGCALLAGNLLGSSVGLTDLLYDEGVNMMTMVIYSLIVIGIFSMWYYSKFEGDIKPPSLKTANPLMIASLVIMVPGAQYACGYIMTLTAYVRPDWYNTYESIMESSGIFDTTFLTILYTVILGPICEELLFRGVALRCAKAALPFWFANFMQAILFGVFHMNWMQGVYTFALGLLLGYVCERGGSIYLSILLHMLFNLYAQLSLYLPYIEETALVGFIILLITIVSLVGGIMLFRVGIKKRSCAILEQA